MEKFNWSHFSEFKYLEHVLSDELKAGRPVPKSMADRYNELNEAKETVVTETFNKWMDYCDGRGFIEVFQMPRYSFAEAMRCNPAEEKCEYVTIELPKNIRNKKWRELIVAYEVRQYLECVWTGTTYRG